MCVWQINWNQSAQEIHNFIRGNDKVPGAWTTINGEVSDTATHLFHPSTCDQFYIKGVLVLKPVYTPVTQKPVYTPVTQKPVYTPVTQKPVYTHQ